MSDKTIEGFELQLKKVSNGYVLRLQQMPSWNHSADESVHTTLDGAKAAAFAALENALDKIEPVLLRAPEPMIEDLDF